MKYLKVINLEIDREYYNPIPAQQGDTARVLNFKILNNGVSFNLLNNKSVRVRAQKPDGTKIWNDLIITDRLNGECSLNLTNQILAVPGWCRCQLEITDGEDILSTIIFTIDIRVSIDVDEAVESTNEFTALENVLISVQEWDKYFQETSGKIEEKYTDRLNKLETDNIVGGFTHEFIEEALNKGGCIRFPEGVYTLDKSIAIKNKSVKLVASGNVTIIGAYNITFSSDLSDEVNGSDVIRGESKIISTIGVSIGDYILINGNIVDDRYIPERCKTAKVVAKVVDKIENEIILDRATSFGLVDVKVRKILYPFTVDIDSSIKFVNSNVSIHNGVGGIINLSTGGKTQLSSPAFGIESSCDILSKILLIDTICNHGVVINNSNNMKIDIISSKCGKDNGSIVKVLRMNAVQNIIANMNSNNSLTGDLGGYGVRDSEFNILSFRSGRYFRDNNITTGNRLETIQFSEGCNVKISSNLIDTDDQGVEFLGMFDSQIYPVINTLENSSEGAIVIKGGSSNIDIINPVIDCYNPYAVKVECSPVGEKRTNNINIINPRIKNSYGVGIAVRDSDILHDANVTVSGGKVEAISPIVQNEKHRGLYVKGTKVITTQNHAIQSLGDYLIADDLTCEGTNGVEVRAIVSSGENDKIRNVIADNGGVVYIRGNAKEKFNIKNYSNIATRLFFDDSNISIWYNNGRFGVESPLLFGIWENSYFLGNSLPKELGNTGSKYIISGWSRINDSWMEHRVLTGN